MRVVMEAIHELLDVLVDHGVVGDVVGPLVELRARGEFAVEDEICGLQKRAPLGQLLDGVAPILQDPLLPIDEGDRTLA